MSRGDWLADTATSYDTVAVSYADQVRNALAAQPYLRAVLMLFAGEVRASGGGPVADVGCGPGEVTAHLNELGVDAFGISPPIRGRGDYVRWGFTVVVISPKQIKHLRSRYGSAGNKDDRFDAYVLADTLRSRPLAFAAFIPSRVRSRARSAPRQATQANVATGGPPRRAPPGREAHQHRARRAVLRRPLHRLVPGLTG